MTSGLPGSTEPAFAAPLAIGELRLRNRFVSAPMERNYGTRDGCMTDAYVDYLARRGAGGAALVFTEATYVRADGKGRIRQLGADHDRCIAGLAQAADAVHAHGALIGVELNHGGRTAQSAVSGFAPVAPTPIPCEVAGGEMPVQLDSDDIEQLVACFGAAARRCREAGIDAISLHGGHGYLIHQFMSPAWNRRDDHWAEPTRFLSRVIDAVRSAAPDLAIGLRFSAFEGTERGLDAAATLRLLEEVDTGQLDFLDVSAGNYEAGQWIVQPGEWPRGVLADHAARYTRRFGVPVGVAGRINTPARAEEVIASGKADFVSLARTLHADPDFPNRALDGGRYRPCIACNVCIDRLAAGPVPCSVNPWVRHQADEPAPLARHPARVAVVGGGPAGLAAARELALSSHLVELFEQRDALGGNLRLAANLPAYPEYHRIIDWYTAELADLEVPCRTGVTADATTLRGRRWDAIVLATGGRGVAPDLPGVETRSVRDVRDFMLSGDPAPGAVTIVGADREAAVTADALLEQGSRVVMVGAQKSIAEDVGRRAKIVLVPRLLSSEQLTVHLSSSVVRVAADQFLIRPVGGGDDRWIDAPGELLVSQGVEPRTELLDQFRAMNPSLGVFAVGDASGNGGSVHAAITSATEVARRVGALGDMRTPAEERFG